MNTKVKICGITNIADAKQALDAGADFLGLIFVDESPRRITKPDAEKIAHELGADVKLVGVFKNAPMDEVNRIARDCRLSFVQLHGKESPDECAKSKLPVIKAFEVTEAFSWQETSKYEGRATYFLLDLPKESGAGNMAQKALYFPARSAEDRSTRLFLAGGLNCDNVGEIVRALSPFAVDVASGVECEPGIKDKVKVEKFCRAVRRGGMP